MEIVTTNQKKIIWSSNSRTTGHKKFLPWLPTVQITSLTTDCYNCMIFYNWMDSYIQITAYKEVLQVLTTISKL